VIHAGFSKICSMLTRMVYSLPFQIGSKVSVKDYNTFLDRNESTGYKFYWNKGNVYIIEMANSDHEYVISVLQECFRVPNNNVICGPIKVCGQPCKRFPFSLLGLWLVITIHIFSYSSLQPN
jgi:hypothetical protein